VALAVPLQKPPTVTQSSDGGSGSFACSAGSSIELVLVIAHNADFDRRFLERRLPVFATKDWPCSRFDIDWKAEGIRSSALDRLDPATGAPQRRYEIAPGTY
jgi:hypothetical protein